MDMSFVIKYCLRLSFSPLMEVPVEYINHVPQLRVTGQGDRPIVVMLS